MGRRSRRPSGGRKRISGERMVEGLNHPIGNMVVSHRVRVMRFPQLRPIGCLSVSPLEPHGRGYRSPQAEQSHRGGRRPGRPQPREGREPTSEIAATHVQV